MVIHPPSLPMVTPTLCLPPTEPLSTVGVDLGIWKYRKDLETEFLKTRKKGSKQLRTVTFYTWDFGGQVSTSLVCATRRGGQVCL